MNVSIYLEDDLYEAVVRHAAKHNVSKNSVIRNAIREMVMEDTPHSMREGQADFAHEQDFSKFSDCKTLKEAFTKAGRMGWLLLCRHSARSDSGDAERSPVGSASPLSLRAE